MDKLKANGVWIFLSLLLGAASLVPAYGLVSRVVAHYDGLGELIAVSKETCYATKMHAQLDTASCYDSSKRGPK